MFNAEKYSAVFGENGHLLQDFLWLLCPPPSAPCCRGKEEGSVLSPWIPKYVSILTPHRFGIRFALGDSPSKGLWCAGNLLKP